MQQESEKDGRRYWPEERALGCQEVRAVPPETGLMLATICGWGISFHDALTPRVQLKMPCHTVSSFNNHAMKIWLFICFISRFADASLTAEVPA